MRTIAMTFKALFCSYFIICNSYLSSSEIYALQEISAALNGDNWTYCNWNFTALQLNKTVTNHCGLNVSVSKVLNGLQTVSGIQFFSDNNLNGTISSYIGNLTHLGWFHLWFNSLLIGTIPESICNLKYLNFLSFEAVNLCGDVPKCIGNLSSLAQLDLWNVPSLTMSSEIFELFCEHNQALEYFWDINLFKINYVGSIPECIGEKFHQLQYITLNDLPNLNSTIPDSFNNFPSLNWVQLWNLPG
eukprot:270467_1